ncbi:MAG: hypothetical protein NT030_01770 [Candidatus Saganbacteria bacterium]|nr:hypothetical protein [Candidatus Saganbacteria bacterium]
MQKIKALIIFLILILPVSGCGGGATSSGGGAGTGPAGERGTAGYYVPNANNCVPSGYVLFAVIGTTVEAISGKIGTNDPESTWIYYYWNAGEGDGKSVITIYNSSSTIYPFTESSIPTSLGVTTEVLAGWNIDSPSALATAEANGGAAFRHDHPNAIVYPSLGKSPPNYEFPVWIVTYYHEPYSLYILINATTGEFILSTTEAI